MIESINLGSNRSYPPRVTAFTERFWTALENGRIETTACTACNEATFPPKPICPHCWHGEVRWITLRPEGRLYSWTRIHAGPAVFEAELPYAVGVVDLDDGIRLALRLHDAPGVEWCCDAPVRLIRMDYADGPLLAAAAKG